MALHRTAFSPLRCVKAAVYAGVKSTGREAQWVADIEGKMISYQ